MEDFNKPIVPSLTLEPELEEAPQFAVAEETALQQPQVEEPVLTAEERQMVMDFAARIDVENTAQILQYGAGTQKKMADFSDAALANARTQDLGEVGDLIVSVVGELKGMDADEEKKGFLGFFRKHFRSAEGRRISLYRFPVCSLCQRFLSTPNVLFYGMEQKQIDTCCRQGRHSQTQ